MRYKKERGEILGEYYNDLHYKIEHYNLNYSPLIELVNARNAVVHDEHLLENYLSKMCLTFKCERTEDNHYVWPIAEKIYKGTKYFYSSESEKQFHLKIIMPNY